MNNPAQQNLPHAAPAADPLSLAESAAKLAAAGDIEAARAAFAQALALAGPDTTDIRILFLLFQFHFRIGELDEAERFIRRRLEVCGPDTDSPDTARAYTNLGLVLQYKGDLDGAEREGSRAVAIDRRIGNDFGVARALGNLGLIPEARGDLNRAESLFREALALAQRIGAVPVIAGMLANLGDIALTRGRADEARDLWKSAIPFLERAGPDKLKWLREYTQKLADLEKAHPPA